MKRYIITLFTPIILLVLMIVLLVYYLQPKPRLSEDFKSINPIHISYERLDRYVDSNQRAYFFCYEDNVDCRYVSKDIITPLVNSAGVNRFDQIFLVNSKPLKNDILPSAIRSRLGFESVPAFVILSKIDNKIVYHSVLEWKDTQPITIAGLKSWMILNGLWLDEYQD
jgi:hypothetical protein